MEGQYEVFHRGQAVGTVEVIRDGLYCRLSCCCRVRDGAIHRLYAGGEKLGVLIPEEGELVLETRVAAKRLKEGCAFSLDEETGECIPIRPGEAFLHLDKLRQGRLSFRNGEPVLIPG